MGENLKCCLNRIPGRQAHVLPAQPAALAYRNLSGFSIEIPFIDSLPIGRCTA
jgi:hypothetical protein